MKSWHDIAVLSCLGALLIGASPAAHAQQTVNYGVQPATMPIFIARELGLLDPI